MPQCPFAAQAPVPQHLVGIEEDHRARQAPVALLAEVIGAEHVLAGKTYAGGGLLGPGLVAASTLGKSTYIGELDAHVILKEEQGNKLESVSFRKIEKNQVDQEIEKYLEHLIVEKKGRVELHLV
jgi:hypothetical protein